MANEWTSNVLPRDLIDGCEHLATTTLHPTDGEYLCEKPPVRIRVTGFSSQPVTLCGRGFGVGHSSGAYQQHGVDRGDDVVPDEEVVLRGAQPQIAERSLRAWVTQKKQVDGPPHQAHEPERSDATRRTQGDEFVRDTQALSCVPRREHGVMEQRQRLRERICFAQCPDFVHDCAELVHRAGVVVGGFRREADPEPQPQVEPFFAERGERVPGERQVRDAVVDDS